MELWCIRCEGLLRAATSAGDADREEALNTWRTTIAEASEFLNQYFAAEGDPNARLPQYQVSMERPAATLTDV